MYGKHVQHRDIQIYFYNIRIKHLQYYFKIFKTRETCHLQQTLAKREKNDERARVASCAATLKLHHRATPQAAPLVLRRRGAAPPAGRALHQHQRPAARAPLPRATLA